MYLKAVSDVAINFGSMEKEASDSTGQADVLMEMDQAKIDVHGDGCDYDADIRDDGQEMTEKDVKRLKEKARKKAKKAKMNEMKKVEEEKMKNEHEVKDTYEVEVAWCIRQLQLGLTNKGVTSDQGMLNVM